LGVIIYAFNFAQTHVYTLSGKTFSLKASLDHLGPVTDVHYSPDGNYLAASDGHRKVVLYSTASYEVMTRNLNRFTFCKSTLKV